MTWQLHSGSGAPGTLPGQTDGDNYIDCASNTLYQLRASVWYSIANFSPVMLPSGSIIPFGGVTVPVGYVWADGSALSRLTYVNLYNALTADKGNFTVSIATPAVVTLNGHGLATGNCVELTTTGALPTGLSVNTNYYVIYVNANTFNLATTFANALAGTKINTSGTQSGVHSLRYCPWGISGARDFLLPDPTGASLVGAGTSTGYTANETIYNGQKHDDRLQGFKVQTTVGVSNRNAVGSTKTLEQGTGVTLTSSALVTDGTNGTPRTGTTTRGKVLGVKFIIKL